MFTAPLFLYDNSFTEKSYGFEFRILNSYLLQVRICPYLGGDHRVRSVTGMDDGFRRQGQQPGLDSFDQSVIGTIDEV